MKIRLTQHLSGNRFEVGYFLGVNPDAAPKPNLKQNATALGIESGCPPPADGLLSQAGADASMSVSAQSADPKPDLLLPGAQLLTDTQGLIDLRDCLGRHFSVRLKPVLKCFECGETFNKLYRGFCYPCLISAPSADACWMNPEHCHHAEGTCRSEAWANARCFIGHCVYLAYTSDFKVGITSTQRVTQRWIEQGAYGAIKLCQTNSRRTAGLIEQYLKQFFKDRTINSKLANQPAGDAQTKASQIDEVAQSLKAEHELRLADWLMGQAPAMRYQWSPLKAYFFDHPNIPQWRTQVEQPSLSLWKQPRGSAQFAKLLGMQGKVLRFDKGYVSIGNHELVLRLIS